MRQDIPYDRFDRALYSLAFANVDLQVALNGVECRLFRDRLEQTPCERPVFVAALPRAGTTLLLDVLNMLPEFAAATYRHMPFALCPLLWPKIAAPFLRRSENKERAHGDGMEVGFDSPEAFEEIIWQAFWRHHYQADRIEPWSDADRQPVFEAFLQDYMRKIIAAGGRPASRYLSKNNANIARLDLLSTLFPDGTIIVPVRHPWSQAASLLRQHRHFCRIHHDDPFARRYMNWLGHFEFGTGLRPIGFLTWQNEPHITPDQPAFWLSCWAACYEAVLAAAPERLVLVNYDGLCASPLEHLESLADALAIDEPAALIAKAYRFRDATPATEPDIAGPLKARCNDIYQALLARCLAPGRPMSIAAVGMR
ncbi:MAG: sulfotransferase [Pseudomonadota bacterium]